MSASPHKVIWLPSPRTTTVEWYMSDGRAVGVSNMSEEWHAAPVTPKPDTGFAPARDDR